MGITDDWKYLENNSILSSGRYHCISAIYPRTFIRWLDSYIKLPYTILYFLITTIIFTLLSLPLAFSLLPPTLTIKNFFIQLYPAIVLFSCFVILNLLIYSFYKEIFNQIYQEGQIFPAYSGNIPFNLEGIPLTAILEFIEQCGGRDQLINLTTSDVCEKYLKPLTKLSNQSYCSYLKDQLHDSRVKQANIFVSHAWRYKFLDVVDALIEHFPNNSMNKEPPILWFDLFR